MSNDDYIKRSDALKAILGVSIYDTIEELEGARTIAENTWADGLYDAYKIIEEEVDATDMEPKQRWIPVTERLPKTNEKVLVYVFDPDFCGPYIEFGHWLNWLKRWGEFDDEVGDFGDYTIIAWMPLPEPPKGEDREIL